jgi:hypothetical protein
LAGLRTSIEPANQTSRFEGLFDILGGPGAWGVPPISPLRFPKILDAPRFESDWEKLLSMV